MCIDDIKQIAPSCLKGIVLFRNVFVNIRWVGGSPFQDPHLLDSTENGYNVHLLLWKSCHVQALHGQPIDFTGSCVMLSFSCGGAAEYLNICCIVSPQFRADPRNGTACDQFISKEPL